MDDRILTALLVVVCSSLVLTVWTLSVGFLLNRKERKLRAELSEALQSFVSAADDGTPSPLAVVMDQAAMLLAARLAQQVKTMLAGVSNGASAEASNAQMEALGSAPGWIGLLANILPKSLKKKMLKNPQMLSVLAQFTGVNGKNGGAQAVEAQSTYLE